MSGWSARAGAILAKDLRAEMRTRYAVNAVVVFALASLVAVSLSLAGAHPGPAVEAAFLWTLLFFSAMAGLARGFVHEEERRTADWLRLGASPSMVYCGKFGANILLLLLIEILVVPLFLALMNSGPVRAGLLLLVLLLGSLGLAAAGTLLAAIVARTRNRGSLFAALAFPLLLPALTAATIATRVALEGGTTPWPWGEVRVLLSYAVVVFTGGLLLFDSVWYD